FEPTIGTSPTPVFKTGAINRSAIPPRLLQLSYCCVPHGKRQHSRIPRGPDRPPANRDKTCHWQPLRQPATTIPRQVAACPGSPAGGPTTPPSGGNVSTVRAR